MSKRLPVLKFKEFCNQFVNRLNPVVKWDAEGEDSILLLMNIVDRSEEGIGTGELVYGGLLEQRDFLPEKKINDVVKKAWAKLSKYRLTEGRVTQDLYQKFINGELGIEGLSLGYLRTYFDIDGNSKPSHLKDEQSLEYDLLNHYFDLEKDCFLSLPIIQFGQFDGVLHIILSVNDERSFNNQSSIRNLIRLISLEYESLLLDWDLVGENIEKKSTLEADLERLTSEDYENAEETNPIFRELKYRRYYAESKTYLLERLKQNNIVPRYIKNEHRKRAIISILIDSYAHNISAHSLTVLKWWFQQRASTTEELQKIEEELQDEGLYEGWGQELNAYLANRFKGAYTEEEINKGIRRDLARWINIVERRMLPGKYLPVRDQFLPLAKQLHPLFRFLLEKGAFWSGITRDQQFGGEIVNLYEILWNDFINNPLYLGTIAYSEGITRLNLNIRFYAASGYKIEKIDDFERTYAIEKDSQTGKPLTGRFATISVAGKDDKSFTHEYLQYQGEGFESHEILAKKLRECEVFFPGGVVGKHAFFTLIENEIRNVKHYPERDLEEMRKNGLDLYIGIRPGSLSTGKDKYKPLQDKQLYKIGIWIGHKTKLVNKEEHLVAKRLELLRQDIITEDTNRARLGGNFQDKICAAMLFNNSFISVEKQESDRAKNYYPWLRSAYSEGINRRNWKEKDYEVRKRNLKEAIIDLQDKHKHPTKGYFKKYFHLWQGKRIYHLKDTNLLKLENVSRFKMVTVEEESWMKTVRSNGVIRVLPSIGELSWAEAYHKWLRVWLKDSRYSIEIKRGGTTVGYLVYDENHAMYYPTDYMMKHEGETAKYTSTRYYRHKLQFAHGDEAAKEELMLSVRSDGILSNYFFDNLRNINDFDQATIDNERAYELLEVLQTKICIFDKRIAERVEDKAKRNYLNEQLHCGIYWEDFSKWEEVKSNGFSNYHFVIVHLSFIEAMLDKKGDKYGEEGIVHFLEEQVGDQLSENCVFVVTTGRGREEWWRKIESSKYAAYTTFRPVEMLIEAVETARLKQDDINLKYNLVKVLFGS